MMDREEDPGWRYLRLSMEEQIEHAASMEGIKGKKMIWVTDPDEGYIMAEIKTTKGDVVEAVNSKGATVKVKKDDLQEVNPPKFYLAEDMSTLTHLNDASVLDNLRQRYYRMLIYTYSGLFCVVINPYKRLPIYTESVSTIYMGKRRNEVPPHLFSVSDEAYRNMLQDRENQSMLITGESGAGKTENTKKVIAYFAMVGTAKDTSKPDESAEKKVSLEDKIVRTNPVLEAFGNAKTVRNNNSSRFGKFIRIHFSKDGRVAGCDIEHYLLEKSRVIKQAPGERCYHIFYQIACGAIKGLKEKLLLTEDISAYKFVNQAELTIDGVDDVEEMGFVDESYDIMGFEPNEKLEMFKMCSGHMHMGLMKFKQRQEQAEPEDDIEEAKRACEMYGVTVEDFLKAICKPRVRVGTEWVNKGQNVDQVNWSIGALAKGIYARMFRWLISRCNETLDARVLERKHFIGVLDIAGFEIFDFNSFEQLWINFVNEKLQQFFNHHMFVLEQEEYAREGIVWTFIDFGLDLQACIELIEKPLGIISMLDEECIVPKATDMTLASKLCDQHLGKHPNFQKPRPPKGKQGEAHFALGHYAGIVRYNTTAWLEKNKDPLNDTCVAVLKASPGSKLLNACWADYATQEETAAKAKEGGGGKHKGKSGSFMTVSMMYRESLNKLMTMLHATHPHFVRCIIPNELKKSGLIDAALCLNQLTCNGVLEGIRICRKGFPNRMVHEDFKQRYAILASTEAKNNEEAAPAVQAMSGRLERDKVVTAEQYRVGKTKVFFKAGVLALLEDARDERIASMIKGFQAKMRWYLALKEVADRKQQLSGYTILQKNIRSWNTMRTWMWYSLYSKIRPMLKCGHEQEEIDKMKQKVKDLEAQLKIEEDKRKALESEETKLVEEKNEVFTRLQVEKSDKSGADETIAKLEAKKKALEKQVMELQDRFSEQEGRTNEVHRSATKCESECDKNRQLIEELELSLAKSQEEKRNRDDQIKTLQDEMATQDENIAKLNKEKKQHEESSRKVGDDLQGEEDKMNHLNKIKTKLEHKCDEIEDALERAKRSRQEVEKSKRKIEGDLTVAFENIDEATKQKHDVENKLKQKEAENVGIQSKIDEESSLAIKLQKQIKELQAKIEERDEELEAERQGRQRTERSKSELQRELEDLKERLDEAGGMTAAQIESNKKREAELAKLRHDVEEANATHETQLSALRKKHNDSVAEMGEQLDQVQKQKTKVDKDKTNIQREVEDLRTTLDNENRNRGELEKKIKGLEMLQSEIQGKSDDQGKALSDYANLKARLSAESGDMGTQLEAAESALNALQRAKTQLTSQLEEAKRTADEEGRERQSVASALRNVEHEMEMVKEQIEEQSEAKAECQREVSKANAEMQLWRAKFESEGLVRADELEENRKKLQVRLNEMQEALDLANNRAATLEKHRHRMMTELEDAQTEVERANTYAGALEKKQKGFDRVSDEWAKKTSDLANEIEISARDNRNLATEAFKLKTEADEVHEQLEGSRRENKSLVQDIKDLTDQLNDGGRSVHELQKLLRRLEAEKAEYQSALDEAEASLEAEESKVMRAQIEVTQIRSEIEKRLQEKEEEFENTRKNHHRALESMQATLETETKAKADLLRIKKKLEADTNELEVSLDMANRSNAEAQKNLHRLQEQVRELQQQLEVEQRQKDDLRNQYNISEKKTASLQAEKEEVVHTLDSTDRARKQCELDANEAREISNEMSAEVGSLTAVKRKLEGEMQALSADLDESLNELKASEDRSRKAESDAARLAEELRLEQDHTMQIERIRKGLEAQLKDMQLRLDEAEAAALKGGKKVIQKLEQRVREIEGEIDNESRRASDMTKSVSKNERRVKELEFMVEEEKKNQDRLSSLIDKLQTKIKTYKRQQEEAEELANSNLQKYRQLQHQVDDAEERADTAEQGLTKLRAKSRNSASMGPGLATSASMHF